MDVMGYYAQITADAYLVAGRYAIQLRVKTVESAGDSHWLHAAGGILAAPPDGLQEILEQMGEELFNLAPLMGRAGHEV